MIVIGAYLGSYDTLLKEKYHKGTVVRLPLSNGSLSLMHALLSVLTICLLQYDIDPVYPTSLMVCFLGLNDY